MIVIFVWKIHYFCVTMYQYKDNGIQVWLSPEGCKGDSDLPNLWRSVSIRGRRHPSWWETNSPQITQMFTDLFWSTDETDDTEAHLLRLCLASGVLTFDTVANSTSIARAKTRLNSVQSRWFYYQQEFKLILNCFSLTESHPGGLQGRSDLPNLW